MLTLNLLYIYIINIKCLIRLKSNSVVVTFRILAVFDNISASNFYPLAGRVLLEEDCECVCVAEEIHLLEADCFQEDRHLFI